MTSEMKRKVMGLALGAAVAMAGGVSADGGHTASYLDGTGYITSVPGNFVAGFDEDICYAIHGDLGLGELRGFKIDPPVSGATGGITYTVSADGKFLSWSAPAVDVLGVVVKGGPSYNLYDYLNASLNDLTKPIPAGDSNLHSPIHKGKISAVSHFNFCYQPPAGDDGCTPGYWRNHADRWFGVTPAADFDATFGVDLFDPNITLGAAIKLQGGGVNALARHATAALLNALGGVPNADATTVDYPKSAAEVIQMVQAAVANDTIEATKDAFAEMNEAGCPLSGTSANPVP